MNERGVRGRGWRTELSSWCVSLRREKETGRLTARRVAMKLARGGGRGVTLVRVHNKLRWRHLMIIVLILGYPQYSGTNDSVWYIEW